MVWCKEALSTAALHRQPDQQVPGQLQARARRLCFEALHVVTHLHAFTLGRIHEGHLPGLLQVIPLQKCALHVLLARDAGQPLGSASKCSVEQLKAVCAHFLRTTTMLCLQHWPASG